MIKSKEYLGNKKEGQNDNYDLTGEETIRVHLQREDKDVPMYLEEARLNE